VSNRNNPPLPVNSYLEGGFDEVEEMMYIVKGEILYAEIVDTETEFCFSGFVCPKTEGEGNSRCGLISLVYIFEQYLEERCQEGFVYIRVFSIGDARK